MQVIICSNTETIRPIWEDIFTDADWHDASDWHEEIAIEWVRVFKDGVLALGYDYECESFFPKWHGGPYRGHWMLRDENDKFGVWVNEGPEYDAVRACYEKASARAIECAKHDVAEMLAAQAAQAEDE